MNPDQTSNDRCNPDADTMLMTFAIICFEQESYIKEAVDSALAQTYSPLEIIISDDCSSDSTYDIVTKIVSKYDGLHKVVMHRNSKNLGLAGNINKVWELSSGDYVVFQGGDDVSLPQRTMTIVEAICGHEPRPDLVYSGEIGIDENGAELYKNTSVISESPEINDTITGKKCFIAGGCVAAYARTVHFTVGPLNQDVVAEDFVYSFRALLGNGALGISEPLVRYRHHTESIIGKTWRGTDPDDYDKKVRKLAGSLSILKEYLRAMRAYKVENRYLYWRLKRNIRMTEVLLYGCDKGLLGKLAIMAWAAGSVRPRAFLSVLSDSVKLVTNKAADPKNG